MVVKRQSSILTKLGVLKSKQAVSDRTECVDCAPVDNVHYKYCQMGACQPKRSASCCQFCSVSTACSAVCASVVKPKRAKKSRKDTGLGPIWRDL